ncbi:DUF2207 domain-containing protein [Microbacterium marinilacus]|uniref:DUF2207 domain-containing protein n=1 Tax=Microbacterium marinilacus TaxID=415209 RepID=A0ABP7BMX1_9MICO|nr:DUF2207 domain-containing protein [Microbacterium marinilacus]MBY0688869.1 DUF2207 domain-containing protein [Microbacterium marinilacus]
MTDARDGDPTATPPAEAVAIPPRRQTPLYRWLSVWLLRTEARARARGSKRSRRAARITWGVVAALGVLLLFGPVINAPMGFDDYIDAAESGTETWIARSFEADYTVSREEDGHLAIEVEERITALFPEDVDESSVERVLVGEYEGHDLDVALVSAELDGAAVDAEVRRSATRTELRVDAGERLTGDHDVVLRYTLRDAAADTFDESTRAWTQMLEWDAFGPDWAHGSASTTVTVTMPRDLVDAYARQPRGGVEWLLAADSTALEPDSETADTVTYELTNDQTLPPHSSFWFRFHFAPGTFEMPAPTALYWVMVVGPFVPLLLAALALLLALAARAVAWGDARGRAWYVAQSDPPKGVSPSIAARLWRSIGTAPLVRALAAYQEATAGAAETERKAPRWRRKGKGGRAVDSSGGAQAAARPKDARRALARELHRAGRLGNWPHAWTHYLGAPAWSETFRLKLRRVPHGFVRDNFVGAALALPVVQLGLARQLSHQFPLSVYWWPVAAVAVAILLGALVLVIALTARPLTRPGAFVREHLLGVRLFAERTQLAERGTLADPLLPYAVMFSRPRRAAAIVARAMDDAGVARDVKADPAFLSGGRIALRVGSAVLVVGAFLVAALVPSPTVRPEMDAVFLGDVPGSYGMFVREFAADARLDRSDEGLALAVEERLQVTVADGGRYVRQVTRQWTDRPDGQDQGLVVESVTVDGEEVPFETSRLQGKLLMSTTLQDDWPGEHEVVIAYRLETPAVRTFADGAWHDELRWTAIDPDWSFGWDGLLELGGDTIEVEDVAVSLTMPADLAEQAAGIGALDHRRNDDVSVREPDAVQRDGEDVTYRLHPEPDDDARYLGLQLLFPEGSVVDAERTGWVLWAGWRAFPIVLTMAIGLTALAAALVGIRRGRSLPQGARRDAARWLAPAATVAQLPVFVWTTADWSGDEPWFAPMGILFLVNVVAAIWSLVATRRAANAPAARTGRSRSKPRP